MCIHFVAAKATPLQCCEENNVPHGCLGSCIPAGIVLGKTFCERMGNTKCKPYCDIIKNCMKDENEIHAQGLITV